MKKYFIRMNEFSGIRKNPFVAAILSIFLGLFGVHRFYLKRKISGTVFAALSIISFGFGKGEIAAFLVMISFIEGLIYFLKGIIFFAKKLVFESRNEISTEENIDNTFTYEKGAKKMESVSESNYIRDITDIKTFAIPENSIEMDYRINWIDKLELPYFEKRSAETEQVTNEALKLYEELCEYIDAELRKSRKSFIKETKRVYEKIGGYDAYYLIYCIAKCHVTKVYSAGRKYTNSERYYNLLDAGLGKSLRDEVYKKASEAEKYMHTPTMETNIYFNLTDNGFTFAWWDMDGKIRETRKFSENEINILRYTEPRSTKVWISYEIRSRIILLYLEIWDVIRESLDKSTGWKKRNKNNLKKIIEGQYNYYLDYEHNGFVSSLLKVSENTVRKMVPNIQILSTEKEEEVIAGYMPKSVVEHIEGVIESFKARINNDDVMHMLKSMVEHEPANWKLKVSEIMTAEEGKNTELLISYSNDENFIKIAKEIIKKSEDEKFLLLCLYIIDKETGLSRNNVKMLEDIIHPGNILLYRNMVESETELSSNLSEELFRLRFPVRKKIELDMNKVSESKRQLEETVEIVKEYIGSVEEPENEGIDAIEEVALENIEGIDFEYRDFLKKIIEEGFISAEECKKTAMDKGVLMNAFISDVNKELFDYINDQAVIAEADKIKIDDFYTDMVKELIFNEK